MEKEEMPLANNKLYNLRWLVLLDLVLLVLEMRQSLSLNQLNRKAQLNQNQGFKR
jgi:hypothetical protein